MLSNVCIFVVLKIKFKRYMKQKTIKTEKAIVLAVEVPEEAKNVNTSISRKCLVYDTPWSHVCADLPEGNWQLLGRLPDITEDQSGEIVGGYFNNYQVQQKLHQEPRNDMFWVRYPNGTNKFFDTKDECYSHAIGMEFNHLLQANEVYFENPLGKLHPTHPAYTGEGTTVEEWLEKCKKWEEAQSKVWDKERCYIFIKVD